MASLHLASPVFVPFYVLVVIAIFCICLYMEFYAAGIVQLLNFVEFVSDRFAIAGLVFPDAPMICTFFNSVLNRSSRFGAETVIGFSAQSSGDP